MLNTLFSNTVYVRLKRNQIRLRHLESGDENTVQADPPFTSERMLVGDFTAAEHALKKAMKGFGKKGFFSAAPRMLIQPLEKIEGGLCQIEERVLREMALGAGASKAVVWVGPELIDSQVKDKLIGK
jgi:hypothetical protein